MTHYQIINWAQERTNYPTCLDYIYFMSAANAPLSKAVYGAQRDFLDQLHLGAHTNWQEIIAKVGELRQNLAQLFGGESEDWGIGTNSSHNMNLLSLGLKERWGALEVVSFADEFPSSTVPWKYHGHKLIKINHGKKSEITPELVEASLTEKTKVVVLSHVQYSTGFRSNLREIGARLKARGIYFIVNATQSLGIHPLNVREMNISALTCSGHKWLGAGYGAALLYTSKEMREALHWPLAGTMSFIDPQFKGDLADPRPGTPFVELGAMPFMQILGIHASIQEIKRLGTENIQRRVLELTDKLAAALSAAGLSLGHPRHEWSSEQRSNLLFLKVERPDNVAQRLAAHKILITNRHALLRFSVHTFNNEADIKALLEVPDDLWDA